MVYDTDDDATVSMQYDDALRVNQHQVASSLHSGGYLKKADFTYTADGRPKTMDNDADHVFDRNFTHDFAGRSVSSYFGTYHPEEGDDLNPHIQTITYDAFSNVTYRETDQWGTVAAFARSYTGSTGRMVGAGSETLTYDASGNITYSGITANTYQSTVFDAAGRRTEHTERYVTGQNPTVLQKVAGQEFDGDGDLAISSTRNDQITSPAATGTPTYIYYINSSVLGKTISEIGYVSGSESTRTTRVFAGGAIIAEMRTITGYSEKMAYFHADPVTGSKATVWQSGAKSTMLRDREEFEPLGQFVRHVPPPANEDPPPNPAPVFNDAKFPEWQCKVAAATGKKDSELPTHCGNAERSVWDRYPLSQKDEGNAAKIRLLDSPLLRMEDQARNYALSAAKKKSGPSDDDDDPESPENKKQRRETVTVKNEDDPTPIEIPDFVDASQTSRPLTQQEKKDFDSARERARRAFKDNKKCRDAIATIIKGVAGASFLPDQTITFVDGSSLAMTPINDFVYDAQTDKSSYLNAYDSIAMSASGISGGDGNGVTFGITNRTIDSRTGIILSAPISWNKEFFQLSNDARALHVIHEIIHQYASDVEVANFLAGKTKFKDSQKDKEDASVYFNDYLKAACNLPLQ